MSTCAARRALPQPSPGNCATPGYRGGRSTTSRSSSDQPKGHPMRRVILAVVATAAALVLLLSFKTHTQSAVPGASPAAALGSPTPGAGPGTGQGTGTGASPVVSGAGTASPATAPAGPVRTVTGQAFSTIYGPVQVKITVAGGRITAASAVEYPQDTPRDEQINAYAIPQLNSEAVAAGSAKIDAVSGATYTSGGYIGSLQNALDQLNGACPDPRPGLDRRRFGSVVISA